MCENMMYKTVCFVFFFSLSAFNKMFSCINCSIIFLFISLQTWSRMATQLFRNMTNDKPIVAFITAIQVPPQNQSVHVPVVCSYLNKDS